MSRLVIWGSSWGRGFRYHWLHPFPPASSTPPGSSFLTAPSRRPNSFAQLMCLDSIMTSLLHYYILTHVCYYMFESKYLHQEARESADESMLREQVDLDQARPGFAENPHLVHAEGRKRVGAGMAGTSRGHNLGSSARPKSRVLLLRCSAAPLLRCSAAPLIIYIYMYIYIYMFICTHIHMYIHIYIYNVWLHI